MTTTIQVDGAMGEGGGQVLRSVLSLSLLTGQSFRISRIRANRDRPGLRPQHLAAVQAAARVSGAEVRGDRVGSEEIEFAPGTVRSGDYFFDVGTAGATSLVLQTLALAPGTSSVTIRGGTHVPWSPCFHFLDWQWRPLLARIGVPFELTMTLAGFYRQGGGEPQVVVEEFPAASRGTVLLLLAECAPGRACCFALGARGKRAKRVADEAVDELAAFLCSDAAVAPWLADQLLLPLSMANGPSELRTSEVTRHLLTNAEVIRLFLPVEIRVNGALGAAGTVQVRPKPADPSGLTRGTEDLCSAGT